MLIEDHVTSSLGNCPLEFGWQEIWEPVKDIHETDC